MELTLSQRDQDAIVQKLRIALRQDLKKMIADTRQPEMVDIREAAKILCITPDRLRHIVSSDPHRYPYVKRGDSRNGRLLFVREALLNSHWS